MSGDPSTMVEAYPPEIEALLALERQAYVSDPRQKQRALAHVELAVGLGVVAASAGASTSAAGALALKKLLGVGLTGLAIGGAVGVATTASVLRAPHAPPPATAAAPAGHPSVSPSQPVVPSTSVPSEAPLPPPTSTVAVPASAPVASATIGRGDLGKERELLDVARAALARGRAGDAIDAVEQHARRWPRGYLTEEREVVRIQALVAAGRREEAARSATQFRKSYPKSMLLPAVDAALSPP